MRRSALVVLLLVASLYPVSRARAADAVLDLADVRVGMSFSHVDFGASDSLDRAWAVVHYTERAPCPVQSDNWCDVDVPVRVHVKGLSYDRAKKQVVYAQAGHKPVVCAESKHRPFIVGGGDSLEPTGNCTARVVKATETVDDGFEKTKVTHNEVVLTVQPGRDEAVAGK